MKIIVTGATGFVGNKVVAECIANPAVSSVIVLTRRNIDETLSQNPKVQVILNQDFEHYPQDLLGRLKGSQGCVWYGGNAKSYLPLRREADGDTGVWEAKSKTSP